MSLNILQNQNNQKGAKAEISHNATQNDLSLDPCCGNFLRCCTLVSKSNRQKHNITNDDNTMT